MFKSLIQSLTVAGAMAMPLLSAAPAQAQTPPPLFLTYISGVGSDGNSCSRTAPCQTWAGALPKTQANGIISALDPGGFGPVTINKAITFDGGGGQVGLVQVSGINGIDINAQPSDVVVIRNVRFMGGLGNSFAAPGQTAIKWNSGGRLIVDNCDITGFAQNGIEIAGSGFVAINNTRIENVGSAGILVDSASTAFVKVTNAHVSIANFGFAVTSPNQMYISHSDVSAATGVQTDSGATVVLNDNDITLNNVGINGSTFSYNNNRMVFNGSPGTPPTIIGTTSNPTGMR